MAGGGAAPTYGWIGGHCVSRVPSAAGSGTRSGAKEGGSPGAIAPRLVEVGEQRICLFCCGPTELADYNFSTVVTDLRHSPSLPLRADQTMLLAEDSSRRKHPGLGKTNLSDPPWGPCWKKGLRGEECVLPPCL